MPFTFTAAHSSRITKPRQKTSASLKRALSSGREPIQRSKTKADVDNNDESFGHGLEDLGLVSTLPNDANLQTVIQTINHVLEHMFDDIPERAGMNSTRITEILNFRRNLPPFVTNAHVHAMAKSSTLVERETADLVSAGLLKRINVPGRGLGVSSLSDGLVTMADLENMVKDAKALPIDAKEHFVSFIKSNPRVNTMPSTALLAADMTALIRAGFLTASSSMLAHVNTYTGSRNASAGTLVSIESISRAASGSLAAAGGLGATHEAGAGGAGVLQNHASSTGNPVQYRLSLPNAGAYLKLVSAARSYLIALLSKSKYNEAPLYLLRERWDGGISATKRATGMKDPFSALPPGRSKKWKDFYGLKFDWVLAEALGGGLVEVFNTRSVGLGVRAV